MGYSEIYVGIVIEVDHCSRIAITGQFRKIDVAVLKLIVSC